MREILYRGKRVDNGEWVYGYYYKIPAPPVCFKEDEKVVKDKHFIILEHPNYVPDWGMPRKMVQVEVDPETVGQYTGKKEEDGSKIFEGDCLGVWGENDRGDEAFAVMGVVTWVDDMGRFLLMDGRGYANDWTYEKDAQPENWGLLMIEGNIHDNPELLRIVNE